MQLFFREIAWYPPQKFDETYFLAEAYQLEDRVLSKGIGELWKALWSKGNPSGLLLPIEGAFSGLVFGGTRLPQLCILFIAFSTLQLVAFATARAVWNRRAYAYMVRCVRDTPHHRSVRIYIHRDRRNCLVSCPL